MNETSATAVGLGSDARSREPKRRRFEEEFPTGFRVARAEQEPEALHAASAQVGPDATWSATCPEGRRPQERADFEASLLAYVARYICIPEPRASEKEQFLAQLERSLKSLDRSAAR